MFTELFRLYDSDHSGYLSYEELVAVLTNVTEGDPDVDFGRRVDYIWSLFQRMDTNGDGQISLEEFKSCLSGDVALENMFKTMTLS